MDYKNAAALLTVRHRNIIDAENELFSIWEDGEKDFVRDGLIDEKSFLKSEIKTVFVLEQCPSGLDETNDIRICLKDHLDHPVWINLARWSHAIQFADKPILWNEIEKDQIDTSANPYFRSLQNVGVMCIVKTKKNHSEEQYYEYVMENADCISCQLSLYEPDIVIMCGEHVSNVLDGVMQWNPTWEMTSKGIYYFKNDKEDSYVAFEKPDASVGTSILYYALKMAVSEILL